MSRSKQNLDTLNTLRSYLSEIEPINHDAIYQRLIEYKPAQLLLAPARKKPIPTTYRAPKAVTAYGIPLINTRYPESPPRIPPSALSSTPSHTVPSKAPPKVERRVEQQVETPNFDLSRVREGKGSYTVKELKDIARELGVSTTGKKAELIDRIKALVK